jgi:hypothetical protein
MKQPDLDVHRLERISKRPIAESEHMAMVKANDSTASRMMAAPQSLYEMISSRSLWMGFCASLRVVFYVFRYFSQVILLDVNVCGMVQISLHLVLLAFMWHTRRCRRDHEMRPLTGTHIRMARFRTSEIGHVATASRRASLRLKEGDAMDAARFGWALPIPYVSVTRDGPILHKVAQILENFAMLQNFAMCCTSHDAENISAEGRRQQPT